MHRSLLLTFLIGTSLCGGAGNSRVIAGVWYSPPILERLTLITAVSYEAVEESLRQLEQQYQQAKESLPDSSEKDDALRSIKQQIDQLKNTLREEKRRERKDREKAEREQRAQEQQARDEQERAEQERQRVGDAQSQAPESVADSPPPQIPDQSDTAAENEQLRQQLDQLDALYKQQEQQFGDDPNKREALRAIQKQRRQLRQDFKQKERDDGKAQKEQQENSGAQDRVLEESAQENAAVLEQLRQREDDRKKFTGNEPILQTPKAIEEKFKRLGREIKKSEELFADDPEKDAQLQEIKRKFKLLKEQQVEDEGTVFAPKREQREVVAEPSPQQLLNNQEAAAIEQRINMLDGMYRNTEEKLSGDPNAQEKLSPIKQQIDALKQSLRESKQEGISKDVANEDITDEEGSLKKRLENTVKFQGSEQPPQEQFNATVFAAIEQQIQVLENMYRNAEEKLGDSEQARTQLQPLRKQIDTLKAQLETQRPQQNYVPEVQEDIEEEDLTERLKKTLNTQGWTQTNPPAVAMSDEVVIEPIEKPSLMDRLNQTLGVSEAEASTEGKGDLALKLPEIADGPQCTELVSCKLPLPESKFQPISGKMVVTQNFGVPWSVNESKVHTGIDYAADKGQAVYSMGNGVVFRTGELGIDPKTGENWGSYVIVLHNDGSARGYLHLESPSLQKDDKVSLGDPIGSIFKNHLHYNYCKSAYGCQKGALPRDEFENSGFVSPIYE